MSGGEFVSFNNAVFLSERENADRNYALAFYMRENKCFPEKINLRECLDFYFQVSLGTNIANSFTSLFLVHKSSLNQNLTSKSLIESFCFFFFSAVRWKLTVKVCPSLPPRWPMVEFVLQLEIKY